MKPRDIFNVAYAQLGIKRGKDESIALLLEPIQFPGSGWKRESIHTMRSGIIGDVDEIAVRARKSGCISAWGYFKQPQSATRVLIKVGPLDSGVDAISKVSSFEGRMMMHLRQLESVGAISARYDLQVPEGVSAVGIEYVVQKGRAKGRNFKDMCGSVGRNYYSVSCYGLADGWAWDDVIDIARLQRNRIISMRSRY